MQALVLCMSQQLAPRVIQVAGSSSRAVSVFKSVLAGCKFSKALTALYLQAQMKEVDRLHAGAHLGVFMDDTSMQFVGKSIKKLRFKVLSCMETFHSSVKRLRLTLSPKAVISSSSSPLAKLLHKDLDKLGMKFVISKITRDLRVTYAAGKGRPTKLVSHRMVKSRVRQKKISQIAKISRQARKLYSR